MDVALAIFLGLFALIACAALVSVVVRKRKFEALARLLGGNLIKTVGSYSMTVSLDQDTAVRYEIISLREGEGATAATRVTTQVSAGGLETFAIMPRGNGNFVSRSINSALGNLAVEINSGRYGPLLPSVEEVLGGAYTVFSSQPELGQRVVTQAGALILETRPMSLTLAVEKNRERLLQMVFRREILELGQVERVLEMAREILAAIRGGGADAF